jgi:hypothetical protein
VRIQGAALEGVEGILMSSSQTVRLVLSISLLQRSVLLEISADAVTLSQCSSTAPFELVKGD